MHLTFAQKPVSPTGYRTTQTVPPVVGCKNHNKFTYSLTHSLSRNTCPSLIEGAVVRSRTVGSESTCSHPACNHSTLRRPPTGARQISLRVHVSNSLREIMTRLALTALNPVSRLLYTILFHCCCPNALQARADPSFAIPRIRKKRVPTRQSSRHCCTRLLHCRQIFTTVRLPVAAAAQCSIYPS